MTALVTFEQMFSHNSDLNQIHFPVEQSTRFAVEEVGNVDRGNMLYKLENLDGNLILV